jgi:hypothetical protein
LIAAEVWFERCTPQIQTPGMLRVEGTRRLLPNVLATTAVALGTACRTCAMVIVEKGKSLPAVKPPGHLSGECQLTCDALLR